MRPLTRRQRSMLRDAYEYANTHARGNPESWAALMSPAPRIGDLRVLAGLVKRKLMRHGNHGDDSPVPECWPRHIAITKAGYEYARERWPPVAVPK